MQNNEEFFNASGDEFFSSADAVPTAGSAVASPNKITKVSNTIKTVNDSGILKNAGDFFGSLKKKPSGSGVQETPTPTIVQMGGGKLPKEKDNTMLYVGIGGGVLALGLIVFLATRK